MELEIVIGPDGKVVLDIKGVKGRACLKIADLFKKILGSPSDKKLKTDYYEPDTQVQRDVRNT